MTTYRTDNHWGGQTIIRVGAQPPAADGRRPDDQLVALVDSSAPDGLAERICTLLNGDARPDPAPCSLHTGWADKDGRWIECSPDCLGNQAADSCTCRGEPDPNCVVHHGRRARGPKPPPLGHGCICDGSGRTCPRHGAVI